MSQGIKKLDENIIANGRSLSITNSSIKDNTNFQVGTLKCYPTDSGLRFKYGLNDYRLFDAPNILQEYSIIDKLIGNQEITTRAVKDLNITTDKIAERSVIRSKIALNAIGEQEVDSDAIKTRHISNEQITTEKLADASIVRDKIKDGEVIAGKLAADSVISVNIVNGSITNNKILDSAITNEKIFNSTIKNEKLEDLTIQGGKETGIGKIAENTITSFNIADNAITTAKVANGCITGEKIAYETITSQNIKISGIESPSIANGAIIADKLADNSIITNKILDKAITKEKLSDDIFATVNNAVVYEQDDLGNNCVRIKDGNYFSVMGGNVTVNGTVTADRVYNMAYSDLAEGYIPGEELEPGDEVYLRDDGKVYKEGECYVGIISDEYAMCLGASDEELKNKTKVAVALIGKVHVKTKYAAKLGQKILKTKEFGYIGKALESKFDIEEIEKYGYQKVLTLVYPN